MPNITVPGAPPPAPPPYPGMVWNASIGRWVGQMPQATSVDGLSGTTATTTAYGPGDPGTQFIDTRTGQPAEVQRFQVSYSPGTGTVDAQGRVVGQPNYGGALITPHDDLVNQGLIPASAPLANGSPGTNGLSNGTSHPVDANGQPIPNSDGTFDANGGSPPAADPNAAAKAAADKDAENAQKLRDSLQAERNPAPGVAPQVGAPAPIKAAQVGTVAPVTSTAPKAAVAAAPGTVTATAPKAGVAVAPGTITTQPVVAGQVATTPLAQATQAQAATLDKTAQDQFRDQQTQLSSAVMAAALGTGGPSAAEIQSQRQMQQAQNQQRALAASVHGYGGLAAQRQAGRNIANLDADAVLQGALLRAKETETARGQAIEATGQARGQDIGIAGTEAGFQQGANLQNAQLSTAVSQSNAGLESQRAIEQAKNEQQAHVVGAQLGLDAAKANQEADLRTALQNAQQETQTNISGAQLGLEAGKANQDADLRTALANAANETQTNIVGATEANKVAMSNQDVELKAKLAQAGFDQQALLQMSDEALKAKLANAGFQLTQEQIDVQRKSAADSAAIQMTQALLNYRTGQAQQDGQRAALAAQIEQARKSGNMQLVATLLTVGGALLAGTLGGGNNSNGTQPGGNSPGAPGPGGNTPGSSNEVNYGITEI